MTLPPGQNRIPVLKPGPVPSGIPDNGDIPGYGRAWLTPDEDEPEGDE